MADGRRRDAWNHTAPALAMLHNANRKDGARALSPRDFHPYAAPAAVPTPAYKPPTDIQALRVFLRG